MRGVRDVCPHLGQISFIFMQFSLKNLAGATTFRVSSLFHLGKPGAATAPNVCT